MANSEGLEARYSAIVDGISSLKDMQPSYPSFQVSRIPCGSGGASGRASPATGTYQRASSGTPRSRVGSSASLSQPSLPADVAAFNSIDSQRTAAQPIIRTRTARPASRERTTSAWAAPQYNAGAEQQQHSQLNTHSWMPGDISLQSCRAIDRTSPEYKPRPRPLSRQVTAPQVATIQHDYSPSSSWSSAHKLRPSSAHRQSSAKAYRRSHSRQQDYDPSVPAGGVQTLACICMVVPTHVV